MLRGIGIKKSSPEVELMGQFWYQIIRSSSRNLRMWCCLQPLSLCII